MRWIILPYVYTFPLARPESTQYSDCLFFQVAFPMSWTFGKILRTPLFDCPFPVHSGGDSGVVGKFYRTFLGSLCAPPFDFMGVLCAFPRVNDRLTAHMAEFMRYLDYLLVPHFLGTTKFSEVLICECEQCPGNYSPCLIVFFLVVDKVLMVSLPFSLMAFPMYLSFLLFYRSGDN